MPTISVVICAFTAERWPAISAALRSIASQSQAAHEIVLVIDHNPELLERARIEWPDVVVVPNDGVQGLSDARNTGVAACKGEIVAFLDDDATAPPQWLETLVDGYRNPDVVAVGGRIRPRWQSSRPHWFPPEFDWVVGCAHSGMPDTPSAVRNLIGAGMSFRRDVLDDLGGFRSELGRIGTNPVAFFSCDDTEMCIRATGSRPGATVLYDPAAVVDHEVPDSRTSLRYFLGRCLAEGRSKAILARMAGATDALSSERSYVRVTLPAGLRRGVRDAVRGDLTGLARAAAIVVGLLTTAAGYAIGLAATLRSPRAARPAKPASAGVRVLMVTPRYLPDMGGVERHVDEVSRRLHASGCEVTVLCTDPTGSRSKAEQRNGVVIRRVRAWPSRRDYYLAPGLWRAMRREAWDVVHVQSYHTFVAPLAMFRALVLGIPYVLTFHGGGHSSRMRNSLRPLQRRLLGPLVRRASRLVAIARFEVPLYSREFGVDENKFVLIPNGIEIDTSKQRTSVESNGVIIASVGRLERYKGHHRVLAALPDVLRLRPDVSLWIVGAGPEEGALHRQAEQLGVVDRVVVRSVPSDDPSAMLALLRATSVVVSLSEFETQPLAALEALSAGCSLLVADTSGLKELADTGVARAIPLDSTPHQVADAIVTALGAERASVKLDVTTWDECAAGLLALYQDISCAF